MDAPAIGRVAALDAGLPVTVTGLQVDRRCGSGLQAVLYAAMQVQTGVADVVLAGGAESMSNAAVLLRPPCAGAPAPARACCCTTRLARGRVTAGGSNYPVPGRDDRDRREPPPGVRDPPRGAGRVRRPLPPAGRRRAGRGPVRRRDRAGHRAADAKGDTVVDRDEHIRPDTTLETLARLRPDHGPRRPRRHRHRRQRVAARTTAPPSASSPPPRRAAELGLRPLVRLVSWAVAGVPPHTMGIGPVPATARALDGAGLDPGRHRPDRAQRGLRRPGARRAPGSGSSPPTTSTGSTSTAPASRSATPSAPPAPGSSPP